jgi:hypothetical protein
MPEARPSPLNVVAVAYRWSMGRVARRAANPPLDIEDRLGRSKRGTPWPRLAVPFVLSLRFLEILALTVIPGVVAITLARTLEVSAPAVAAVLFVAGVLVASFPLALFLVVGIWCLLPERRSGGFLRHPDRLWGPSIATLLLLAMVGLLSWGALPLAG